MSMKQTYGNQRDVGKFITDGANSYRPTDRLEMHKININKIQKDS